CPQPASVRAATIAAAAIQPVVSITMSSFYLRQVMPAGSTIFSSVRKSERHQLADFCGDRNIGPAGGEVKSQTAWETAVQCATLAQEADDPQEREHYERLRDAWTTLAKRCEPFNVPDASGSEK